MPQSPDGPGTGPQVDRRPRPERRPNNPRKRNLAGALEAAAKFVRREGPSHGTKRKAGAQQGPSAKRYKQTPLVGAFIIFTPRATEPLSIGVVTALAGAVAGFVACITHSRYTILCEKHEDGHASP